MLNARTVKKHAKRCGADIVGIASIDRFRGVPAQFDPKFIMPEAKSLIVMGFRIYRGTLRGIEEGTFFTSYSSMGYAGINMVYQPVVLWNFCKLIEDSGYEAVPLPNQGGWAGAAVGNAITDYPDKTGKPYPGFSKPAGPGKPAPDVIIHFRIAAVLAGLGEIGWSNMFLSPQFGPRQRLAAVLTDAPLSPDPVLEPNLCDRCMSCAKDCAAGAIPASGARSVKLPGAGITVEWADIDYKKCFVGFRGANRSYNPFIASAEDEADFAKNLKSKVGPFYGYGTAIEGARGCIRACMVHLEKQGKLANRFKSPFRRRKPWKL